MINKNRIKNLIILLIATFSFNTAYGYDFGGFADASGNVTDGPGIDSYGGYAGDGQSTHESVAESSFGGDSDSGSSTQVTTTTTHTPTFDMEAYLETFYNSDDLGTFNYSQPVDPSDLSIDPEYTTRRGYITQHLEYAKINIKEDLKAEDLPPEYSQMAFIQAYADVRSSIISAAAHEYDVKAAYSNAETNGFTFDESQVSMAGLSAKQDWNQAQAAYRDAFFDATWDAREAYVDSERERRGMNQYREPTNNAMTSDVRCPGTCGHSQFSGKYLNESLDIDSLEGVSLYRKSKKKVNKLLKYYRESNMNDPIADLGLDGVHIFIMKGLKSSFYSSRIDTIYLGYKDYKEYGLGVLYHELLHAGLHYHRPDRTSLLEVSLPRQREILQVHPLLCGRHFVHVCGCDSCYAANSYEIQVQEG